MTDNYRNEIKHSGWTWRECKVCSFHRKLRHKDRVSGRAAKRSAKQKDRRELNEAT